VTDCGCNFEIQNQQQGKILFALLLINALMFLIEIGFGIISESSALIADSLDMLADAAVYGIALYAVGRSAKAKEKSAYISGIFQIILGLLVLADVLRRFIYGSEPDHQLMMIIGAMALVANLICLKLISKHRDGEVHMRASWIFSKNDVIANLGILLGATLVYLTHSRYPDLVIGLIISLIVLRGGIQIITLSKAQHKKVRHG